MAIHPTAIVDRRAELAHDVEVGPFCVIEGEVRIEAGCRLYQNVYVTGWTEIGERCELHPGVIVGHAPQDAKYRGERSYCRIGPGTILREHVTIHRGTTPDSETVVGANGFLLGGSHVAHNCALGERVTLINNVLLGGHVTVGDGTTLGGGAVVQQFVRVGEQVMAPGNARVIQDIIPFALLDVEGRIAGLNRVGLRRAGFTADQVRNIREGYRLLFGSDLPFSRAVVQLAETAIGPPVDRIIHFLQQESCRGTAGRSRRRRPDSSESPAL